MAYAWLWGLAAAACLVARPAAESSAVARDGPAEVVGANRECMSSCRCSSHQCELGWLQEVVAGVHTVMGASDGSRTCHIQYVTSGVCCWHMLWCRPMAEVGVRCKPMLLWEPRPLAWTLTIANARQGTRMTWSELLSCMRDHKNQTHCRCWFQAPVWGWEREQERSQAGSISNHENVGCKNVSGETSGALGRLWLPRRQKLLGSSVEQPAIVVMRSSVMKAGGLGGWSAASVRVMEVRGREGWELSSLKLHGGQNCYSLPFFLAPSISRHLSFGSWRGESELGPERLEQLVAHLTLLFSSRRALLLREVPSWLWAMSAWGMEPCRQIKTHLPTLWCSSWSFPFIVFLTFKWTLEVLQTYFIRG